jgi:cbb3-type cytochrome oxidase subunit 3
MSKKFFSQIKSYWLIFFLFLNFSFLKSVLAAEPDESILGQLKSVSGKAGYGEEVVDENVLATKIGNIISIFLGFLGIIFFLFILYGGWIWMKAKGNEEQVTRAKDIITNSVIGILIILGAYILTRFIVSSLSGAGKIYPGA